MIHDYSTKTLDFVFVRGRLLIALKTELNEVAEAVTTDGNVCVESVLPLSEVRVFSRVVMMVLSGE